MGLIQPAGTNSLALADYELAKFTDLNGGTNPGTAAVRVVLAGGTTSAGTINAGTINAGTVRNDGRPARNILSYGTTFGGTAAGYGTLVAAPGVGTSIWVNDISITNSNGSVTCLAGFGTALNGTSVLAKGNFGTHTGIGIQKSYPMAVNAGMTNTDLVCYVGAAGTAEFTVTYFISA